MTDDPDDPDEAFLRDVKAILAVEEAKEARERARPAIDDRIMRPCDWANMASYFLPMAVMVGLYLDAEGAASGAVAVALLTALIVGVLHYINSFHTEDY